MHWGCLPGDRKLHVVYDSRVVPGKQRRACRPGTVFTREEQHSPPWPRMDLCRRCVSLTRPFTPSPPGPEAWKPSPIIRPLDVVPSFLDEVLAVVPVAPEWTTMAALYEALHGRVALVSRDRVKQAVKTLVRRGAVQRLPSPGRLYRYSR